MKPRAIPLDASGRVIKTLGEIWRATGWVHHPERLPVHGGGCGKGKPAPKRKRARK